jgi:hypothetical protein
MELPGWNSIPFTGLMSNVFFWLSIGALVLLGVAEVLSHRYGGQHDLLVAQQQQTAKDASDGVIARLQRDTAQANARAAEAQLALEQLRAPRALSPLQQAAIAAVAARHKNLTLHIFMAGDSADISPLAAKFSEMLRAGGNWTVEAWTWTGVGPVHGVAVMVKPDAKPENVAIARELLAAINGNTAGSPEVWPGKWDSFGGMLNGPPFGADKTEIRLLIGSKRE